MEQDDTFDDLPLVEPGQVAGPLDSARLVAQGGQAVNKIITLTGKDKFEHMVLFCLTLLDQAKGKICAFYLQDFDDCDEHTLRVLQNLIGRAGYVTSDYNESPSKQYKGFWAWRKKG